MTATDTAPMDAPPAPVAPADTDVAPLDAPAEHEPQTDAPGDAETFPRDYVERLRRENARYRDRAGLADAYAQRLHTALVAASGRMADPSDLPYDEAHLADPDALADAMDDLLARKPHLADRRPRGDVGQGARAGGADVDLAGLLRGLAS